MTIDPLIKAVETRLPELAWKISLLPHRMTLRALPKNLFALSPDAHPSACVAEIKEDLSRLYGFHHNEQKYCYLATRIEQKIEVLVRLCQIETKKQGSKLPSAQMMMRLCRRKHWVEELEQTINQFKQQYQHLKKKTMECKDTEIQLAMQAELGVLQKKITLLEEKLEQTSVR